MATQLQIRRGSSAQVAGFTGAEGEIVVNTTNDSVHVNDGSTAGGFELARADLNNVSDTDLNAALTGNTVSALTVTALTTAGVTTTGDISFGDNDKAIFGAGSDLSIFHSGSRSTILDSGTGALRIAGTNLEFKNAAESKFYANASDGGAFNLYYDNAIKLATTSTGIDVTGTVTADGLTVTGTLGNFAVDTQGAIVTLSRPSTSYIRASDVSGSLRFDTGGSVARLNIANNGDISFYEDTGTTPKFFWDSSSTRLTLDGAEASRSSNTYLLDIDNSAQTSNMSTSGPFRVKGYYGDSFAITGAGNVGIGTTSPNRSLHIIGQYTVENSASSPSGALLFIPSSDANRIYSRTSNASSSSRDLAFVSGSSEAMRISSGNVLVGTDSGDAFNTYAKLRMQNDNHAYLQIKANSAKQAGVLLGDTDDDFVGGMVYDNSDNSLRFNSGDAEALRISSDRHVRVNTTDQTNAGTRLAVWAESGSVSMETRCKANVSYFPMANYSAAGSYIGGINASTTATSLATSSDQRLKENIADADDAGSKVDAIQVRQFDWIANNSHQDYGMVAQELQEVIPDVIHVSPDADNMLSVDYAGLVPMMLKEIQSLRSRVAQLENN